MGEPSHFQSRTPPPGQLYYKMAGDKLSWTPEQEVALFHAMQGHKPVGRDSVFFNAMSIAFNGTLSRVV